MTAKIVELGSLCEFTYGDGLPERDRCGGEVPVFGSNGIVGWHNKSITRAPVLIIGRKGSIGEVHYSKIPSWPIDTTYYVDRTKVPCDLKWLYYVLLALDLTKLNKAAAVPGLNRNDAYEKLISLPPLEEQRRIAAVLAKADRLRQMRRYALQLSDTYLQSVFLQMFGDPVTNPMGWHNVRLDRVTESLDSHRIPIEASIRKSRNGKYPYYGASGIIDYIDDYIFDEETLLVAKDGANLLARTTPIAFKAMGKYWVNNHAHVLRVANNSNIDFLCYLLNRTDLAPYVTGSAQPKLTAARLNQMCTILPPLHLQEKFSDIAQHFEHLRAQQCEAIRQADHLFDTLLHRAFHEEL